MGAALLKFAAVFCSIGILGGIIYSCTTGSWQGNFGGPSPKTDIRKSNRHLIMWQSAAKTKSHLYDLSLIKTAQGLFPKFKNGYVQFQTNKMDLVPQYLDKISKAKHPSSPLRVAVVMESQSSEDVFSNSYQKIKKAIQKLPKASHLYLFINQCMKSKNPKTKAAPNLKELSLLLNQQQKKFLILYGNGCEQINPRNQRWFDLVYYTALESQANGGKGDSEFGNLLKARYCQLFQTTDQTLKQHQSWHFFSNFQDQTTAFDLLFQQKAKSLKPSKVKGKIVELSMQAKNC